MSYIGNTPTQQAFTPQVDYFNGTGSQTAFTLSRPVASVAQVEVTVNNVKQNPSTAYTVSGNTITFTGAPSIGTNNVYVRYTSPITQVIQPGAGTVGNSQVIDGSITPAKMSTGAPTWDTNGNLVAASLGTSTSHRGNVVAISKTNGAGYNVTQRLSDGVANSADMSMLGAVTQFSNNGVVSHTANYFGIGLGAATPSSGTGIAFPAAQSASSDANTLDDYEEGTWTPSYTNVTSSGGITSANFRYTKIGRLVYICGLFYGTGGGTVTLTAVSSYITGLPFTTINDGQGITWSVAYSGAASSIFVLNRIYTPTVAATTSAIYLNAVYETST